MTTSTANLIQRIIERAHTIAAAIARFDRMAALEALLEVLPLDVMLTGERRRMTALGAA